MGIFMKDVGIIASGSLMLRCLLVSMPCAGVILVFTTVFQAAGKALPALVLSVSRQGVVFALCIFILSRLAGYYGITASQAAADVLTAVIAVILYMQTQIAAKKPFGP